MAHEQTLSEADRRLLALWAVSCAGRVTSLIEADTDSIEVIQDALDRAWSFGSGHSTAAIEIRKRMLTVKAAGAVKSPAGAAAARSVGQAAAVAHLGAHALGAAAYAVKAVSLANPASPDAVQAERRWQIEHLTEEQRRALAQLPEVGTGKSGPLGPGLLSRGILGETIRELQAAISVEK